MKAIITVGVSGSGKSSLATFYDDYYRIERDLIRFTKLGNEYTGWKGRKPYKMKINLQPTKHMYSILLMMESSLNESPSWSSKMTRSELKTLSKPLRNSVSGMSCSSGFKRNSIAASFEPVSAGVSSSDMTPIMCSVVAKSCNMISLHMVDLPLLCVTMKFPNTKR